MSKTPLKSLLITNILLVIIHAIPFFSVLNMYIGGIAFLKAAALIAAGFVLYIIY